MGRCLKPSGLLVCGAALLGLKVSEIVWWYSMYRGHLDCDICCCCKAKTVTWVTHALLYLWSGWESELPGGLKWPHVGPSQLSFVCCAAAWGEAAVWWKSALPQSAVPGLVSHRGAQGAEQAPLDLPAKDNVEEVLKADTSQEIGLLTLISPFLWEFVALKAEGAVCHELGRTADVAIGHRAQKGLWDVPELWLCWTVLLPYGWTQQAQI